MKNSVIENIVSVWDGTYMPFSLIEGLNMWFYFRDKPRSTVVEIKVNENWNDNFDVVVPVETMKKIIQIENLLSVPTIIAADYNDRQYWVKVSTVLQLMMKNSGMRMADLTYDNKVWIPKEVFTLLIKEGK